jgi:sRNA-binding carbon storage regulator CsrA
MNGNLVIAMRAGEEVLIGDEIVLKFVRISGKRSIRVRISAPKDIVILFGSPEQKKARRDVQKL